MSLRAVAQRVFHLSGGLELIRRSKAGQNRVLTYHEFEACWAGRFEEQCAHIRKHYHCVTLDEVAAFARNGHPLPRNSVAITVDDGYRDFFLNAYPVLRRYDLPAAVFLMTDFLDKVTPWWVRLNFAFLNTPLTSVTIALGNGAPVSYELTDHACSLTAFTDMGERLKVVPNRTRLEFMRNLPEIFNMHVPEDLPCEPMTWDEVREMASNGITFGAHTRSHPILSAVETEEEIRREVFGSRDRIAEELGKPPAHFCYPNGGAANIDERVVRIVEAAGFRSAHSTVKGFNRRGENPYMLKRNSMEPYMPLFHFAQQIAGFRLQ